MSKPIPPSVDIAIKKMKADGFTENQIKFMLNISDHAMRKALRDG